MYGLEKRGEGGKGEEKTWQRKWQLKIYRECVFFRCFPCSCWVGKGGGERRSKIKWRRRKVDSFQILAGWGVGEGFFWVLFLLLFSPFFLTAATHPSMHPPKKKKRLNLRRLSPLSHIFLPPLILLADRILCLIGKLPLFAPVRGFFFY